MGGPRRWHIELVEDLAASPVTRDHWRAEERQPPPPAPWAASIAALLHAFTTLLRRGTGPFAWAPTYEDDAVAWLLDAMSDAVTLWGPDGRMLYQNAAAGDLGLPLAADHTVGRFEANGRLYERRCARFQQGDVDLVLEIVRVVRPTEAG
jgi:hypothetical protein